MSQAEEKEILSWDFAFPLVTNRFFLYDAVKALVWTGGIMILLMAVGFALDGNFGSLWGIFPVLGIILAGFFVMFLLISLIIFGNRYPARFTLTDRAVYWSGRSRVGRKANALAVVLGILARKPAVAGAGMLGAAGDAGRLSWKSVRRIKEYPAERVITIMNGWRVVIRLYCTPENYPAAAGSVRSLAANAARRKKRGAAAGKAMK